MQEENVKRFIEQIMKSDDDEKRRYGGYDVERGLYMQNQGEYVGEYCRSGILPIGGNFIIQSLGFLFLRNGDSDFHGKLQGYAYIYPDENKILIRSEVNDEYFLSHFFNSFAVDDLKRYRTDVCLSDELDELTNIQIIEPHTLGSCLRDYLDSMPKVIESEYCSLKHTVFSNVPITATYDANQFDFYCVIELGVLSLRGDLKDIQSSLQTEYQQKIVDSVLESTEYGSSAEVYFMRTLLLSTHRF